MRIYRKYVAIFIAGTTIGYICASIFYIATGFHSNRIHEVFDCGKNYSNKRITAELCYSQNKIHIHAEDYLSFMPNLSRGDFLDPHVLLTSEMHVIRSPPTLVIGIPTTHRIEKNYLIDTLKSLFMNLAIEEEAFVKFVILIAERQVEEPAIAAFIGDTTACIQSTFSRQLRKGLIEVIVPPARWYPSDLEMVRPTFNDSQKRMLWRTKQNLDYAYLMIYVQQFHKEAKFYMQLEDDISTLPSYLSHRDNFELAFNSLGYVSGILEFVEEKSGWILCEFCTLGFIGKLIRLSDLVDFTNFILFNYREYPVDWILDELFRLKYCHLISITGKCTTREIGRKLRIQRNPPLFQHKGHFSSLDGKVQDLKVLGFEKKNKPIKLRESRNPEPVRLVHNLPTDKYSKFNNSNTAIENFYRKFTPLKINFDDVSVETLYNGLFLEIIFQNGTISSGIEILFSYSIATKFPSDDPTEKIPFHVSLTCDFPLEIVEEEFNNGENNGNESFGDAKGSEDCSDTKLSNSFLDSRGIQSKFYHKFKHKIKISRLLITFNSGFVANELALTMLRIIS